MAVTGWRATARDISALEAIRVIDGPIILTQVLHGARGLRSDGVVPGARAAAQSARRDFEFTGEHFSFGSGERRDADS